MESPHGGTNDHVETREANMILKETRVTHRLAEVETTLVRNFCVVVGRTHSYIGRRSRKEHIDILYLYILVK